MKRIGVILPMIEITFKDLWRAFGNITSDPSVITGFIRISQYLYGSILGTFLIVALINRKKHRGNHRKKILIIGALTVLFVMTQYLFYASFDLTYMMSKADKIFIVVNDEVYEVNDPTSLNKLQDVLIDNTYRRSLEPFEIDGYNNKYKYFRVTFIDLDNHGESLGHLIIESSLTEEPQVGIMDGEGMGYKVKTIEADGIVTRVMALINSNELEYEYKKLRLNY